MVTSFELADEYIKSFLSEATHSSAYSVFQLAGDASNRRYYRVVLEPQSWVLMRWDPFDPNDYPFLSVLNHFAAYNIHVPKVVAMSPKDGLVLLEDLGDLTLERKFWENQNPEKSLPFYKKAMEELFKIHHIASAYPSTCTAFKIQFDTEKLLWEMNYGKDNLLLGILNGQLSGQDMRKLQNIFTDICSRIDKEPKKIAHRDYHSRNLMIKYDEIRVIDFQDARMGSIQYDLVSLLKDSYVEISEAMASELLSYYLDLSKSYLVKDFSREQFELIYELQSIQRCFKACGSFASFYNQRGDRRYLKYISGTLARVIKSLERFPEYQFFSEIMVNSGALERKYEDL